MNKIIFTIVPIFAVCIFIFAIVLMFSPKARGKMMSRQIKASKYMMDESVDDIKSISDNMAYANKDSIKTTARAIKEGFTKDTIYCKHCGTSIDIDSKFCKSCGKEQ